VKTRARPRSVSVRDELTDADELLEPIELSDDDPITF